MSEFESPVDCNSSQTHVVRDHTEILFESPVDCNSSQTKDASWIDDIAFESPVDCNSSQTPSVVCASMMSLRAL